MPRGGGVSAKDPLVARLARGKDKSLRRRHPWVFSGAIEVEPRRAGFGDTVELLSCDGEFLARAAWSPESAIRARAWTFDQAEVVDEAFFHARIARAVAMRRDLAAEALVEPASHRLVHGESDGLPGLVVDRYGDVVVCQFLSAGVERWREAIVKALLQETGCRTLYERSDVDVRTKEGLPLRAGLLAGPEPDALLRVREHGRVHLVDVREGHKTGFYLDQRLGRDAASRWCRGREVLNAFSYTGGFSMAALAGGAASVLDVDVSAPALALASAAVAEAGLQDRHQVLEADVFSLLRRMRDSRRSFDAIVLDPPKFAEARSHLDKALRGYKDINLLAFKLLRPGGVLLTFSCSGLVAPELFQKVVADAAVDARRDAVVVERLGQPADHPVGLAFPEGTYLKGLVCRVS